MKTIAKILPLYCVGEGYSEKEAWDNFQKEIDILFSVIKGFMYWRSSPKLYIDKNLDDSETMYRVSSRIIISDTEFNLKQISQFPPYQLNTEEHLENYEKEINFSV
jgi:hypothetical protein